MKLCDEVKWIAVIRPLSLEGTTLTLGVDNDFYQTWLEENYLSLINNAVAIQTGFNQNIAFQIEPNPKLRKEMEKPRQPQKDITPKLGTKRQLINPLNPNFTFNNLVVGEIMGQN